MTEREIKAVMENVETVGYGVERMQIYIGELEETIDSRDNTIELLEAEIKEWKPKLKNGRRKMSDNEYDGYPEAMLDEREKRMK